MLRSEEGDAVFPTISGKVVDIIFYRWSNIFPLSPFSDLLFKNTRYISPTVRDSVLKEPAESIHPE